jgi:hypothetical protein
VLSANGGDGLAGTVAAASCIGDAVEYQIDLGGRIVRAKGQPFEAIAEGRGVVVQVPPERCYVLEAARTQVS